LNHAAVNVLLVSRIGLRLTKDFLISMRSPSRQWFRGKIVRNSRRIAPHDAFRCSWTLPVILQGIKKRQDEWYADDGEENPIEPLFTDHGTLSEAGVEGCRGQKHRRSEGNRSNSHGKLQFCRYA
jgi:hypothetical protein